MPPIRTIDLNQPMDYGGDTITGIVHTSVVVLFLVMKKCIPPLNALRAFDVVARTGTIAAAAEELSVSGSAVSQQIRGLEKWLGMALFERSAHRLKLTDRGVEYFEAISAAMNAIADATGKLVSGEIEGKIRVSILPSFSILWLLPRIADFIARHPEVKIDLVTSTTLCDFAKDDIDLAVRYGMGNYQGLVVEKLLPDAVVPVCHPRLIGDRSQYGAGGFRAEHLLDLPIIDDAGGLKSVKSSIAAWMMEQGIARPSVKETLFFSDSHLAVEAAKLGEGVLLGRMVLIRDLLESGTLIAPVEKWLVEPTSYYIVHSGLRPLRPRAQTFRAWLKEMARDWMRDPRYQAIFAPESSTVVAAGGSR